MKKLTCVGVAGVLSVAFVAFAAPTVYENDFSRRTSGPVQTGKWHETTYAVGTVAFNYSERTSSLEGLYSGHEGDIQDNWFRFQTSNPTTVTSTVGDGSDNAGDPNQFLRFGSSTKVFKSTGIAQPFYNSFTNGVLRMYADLRAPTNWPAGNGYLRVQPLFRESLITPDWNSGTLATRSFAQFGIQRKDNGSDPSSVSKLFLLTANGAGGDQVLVGDDSKKFQNRHWYRFVMDFDLTRGKSKGKIYDQGETHPKLTDADGALVWTFNEFTANWKVEKAGCGPVEGIALRASDNQTTSPVDRYRETCFDNLVCEWKAPDTDDFVRFYENDFSVRRYRTIHPAGTTAHDYVHGNIVTNTSRAVYSAVRATTTTNLPTQIVPPLYNGGSSRQPIGLAGWRRANTGEAKAGIVTYPDGSVVLQASVPNGGCGYVDITQTLGETITSGKVRYTFDFRTPDKWWWNYHGVYGVLGTADYWGASNGKFTASTMARLGTGLETDSTDNKFYPYYSTTSGATYDKSMEFKSNTWYRAVMTVDLDSRTGTGSIYEIGNNPASINWTPTDAAVFATDELRLRDGTAEISTIGLHAYGAGQNVTSGVVHRRHIYFDNLQVWKDWNDETSSGTLIYRDTFSNQYRYFPAQDRGALIGACQADNGQDHWIRRNGCSGDVWITSGENPCIAAAGEHNYSYAVQALGATYNRGKVHCRADIRPPRVWTWSETRAVQVSLGDDQFFQGDCGTRRRFINGIYGYFGFGDRLGTAEGGVYNNVSFRFADVVDGANKVVYSDENTKIDTSHWYRFLADFDFEAGLYDVTVYDMGTAHPVSDAATVGEPCYTRTGLRFRPSASGGISAICLNTYGNPVHLPNDSEDPGLALYDNLKVWQDPRGASIIIR